MYRAGIRACLEPSFWLGTNRQYAGTFFDYFQLILEFETVRTLLEDVDLADAATDFSRLETAYRAALSVTSQVGQVSLLDFLR